MSLDESLTAYNQTKPCDELEYRGFHILFYSHPLERQIFCNWKNGRLDFGTENYNYKEEMRAVIDDELDTITRFGKFRFYRLAKLEKFQNGGFTDIRLIYRGRLLEVWLNPDIRDLENFVLEAAKIVEANLIDDDKN